MIGLQMDSSDYMRLTQAACDENELHACRRSQSSIDCFRQTKSLNMFVSLAVLLELFHIITDHGQSRLMLSKHRQKRTKR